MPNFRVLSQVVAKKSLTAKKYPYVFYRSDRRKIENLEKGGKMRISILTFIYTKHFAYLKVCTKLENTGSDRSREICDNNFHLRE